MRILVQMANASQTSTIDILSGLNSIPVAFLTLLLSNCFITDAACADTLSIAGALCTIADSHAQRQAEYVDSGKKLIPPQISPRDF